MYKGKHLLLLVFLYCFFANSYSQCVIDVNGLACINNPIEFVSQTPGATNHQWNFNNEGMNNTSSNPTFTFSTLGSKTITYSCLLPNGQTCTTSAIIVIKDKPKMRITLVSNPVQCFENNVFCFMDSSLSGDNDKCIKSIKYLFSDGELITKYGSKNNPVQLPSQICKSYVDPQGGTYDLTVEIEDCNGCIYKQQLPVTMKVELLPSIFAISNEITDRCKGSVNVKFTNLSQIKKSDVSKFKWIFGDGVEDSTSWDSVNHLYTSGNLMTAIYSPRLVIYTGNGCRREFNLRDVIIYNFKPYITKDKDSICYQESVNFELFPKELMQHIIPEKVRWDFNPGVDFGYETSKTFTTIGAHLIACQVSHICGPYTLLDTVVVIGPRPKIEPDFIHPDQRYQCIAEDTVYVVDRSTYYHNDTNYLDDDSLSSKQAGNLKYVFNPIKQQGQTVTFRPYNDNRNDYNVDRVWDFDDDYCLPCTTDRKKNQNVGLNCRFSKDSAERHAYTNWDSVYNYVYSSKNFSISYFDPINSTCKQMRIYRDDSIYLTTDSVLYYGNNPLGINAKDSNIFKSIKNFKMIAPGLYGKGIYDVQYDLRVYITQNSSLLLDKKDGSSPLLINGPQYYDVDNNMRLLTDANDTCLFIFGQQVFKDSLPLEYVRSYHLQVKKVPISTYNSSDSINPALHRRLFYERVPRCFQIRLSLKDTVHPFRCESVISSSIALLPPSAKKLRINDHYCYGYGNKILEFSLEETKPGCMSSFVQFNPDYVNDPNDWHLLNDLYYGDMRRNVFLNQRGYYGGYALEGPNNGLFYWRYIDSVLGKKSIQDINVALIVGNGTGFDMCYDTFYYKNFATFPRLNSDLVFVDNMDVRHHVCNNTIVYATIPKSSTDQNFLADLSQWYLYDNRSGDTVAIINEYYHKVVDHPAYPGKKVNYTVVERLEVSGGSMVIVKVDTLVTAIVHKYKAIALPGSGLNGLREDLFKLGFDVYSINDSTILDLIWNRIGTIGNYSSGSRGCIDTTGYGHLLQYYYSIDSLDVLNFKDSSLYPVDSVLSGQSFVKAYGFKVDKNGSYVIARNVSSYFPGFCTIESFINLVVGFSMDAEFTDTIICTGRIVEVTPNFRYYSLDTNAKGGVDTMPHWFRRQNEAGQVNREGLTIWDYSKEDDNVNNPATIFGSFPYARVGYGNPGILIGGEQNGIYYKKPGIYTLRVQGSDSNNCKDTLSQKIYVTGPRAGFYTDIVTPNCKTILELFDTSYIIDPCSAKGSPPCDFIYKWTINWGDGSTPLDYFKELPKQIGHDYQGNGYFTITMVIETILGCRDTVRKDVFIPGPGPNFKPETKLHICVNDSVIFRNITAFSTQSSQWLWNFGDGFYSPQTDTGLISHRYNKAGQYKVFLNQFDSISNSGKYCSAIYPDDKIGQPYIIVTVWDYDVVKIQANPIVVCVGDSINITASLNSRSYYLKYKWKIDDNLFITDSLKIKFAPNRKGKFEISWEADTVGSWASFVGFYCPDFDTITVYADSVLADFDIDETKKPLYCFTNNSKWATSYRWGFYHDTDITVRKLKFESNKELNEPERNICQDFSENPGINWVCLEARNELGCLDTVCKKLVNDYEVAITPPNVFTPNGNDGFFGTDKEGLPGNNVFNIYTKNVVEYHLIIYDRWGVKVFESFDASYDWNGRVDNTGNECPDGTYYYILDYKYLGKKENEPVINGVVRIIR